MSSWEKVGWDIDHAREQGNLSGGVQPLWRLVRACLEDQRCVKTVEQGQAAFDRIKEEWSTSSGRNSEVASDSGSESDEELRALVTRMEELELERGRAQDRAEPSALGSPLGPPPYNPSTPTEGGGASFNSEVWREARPHGAVQTFLVFADNAGNRYHDPLDFKTVKNLAQSVRAYGIGAAFTVAMVEALGRFAMTPGDWQSLVKASMNPGQYLDWKAYHIEMANEQVARNRVAGNAAWDIDMLMGQGCFANQQTGYPQVVYDQINSLAICAWKALRPRGDLRQPYQNHAGSNRALFGLCSPYDGGGKANFWGQIWPCL